MLRPARLAALCTCTVCTAHCTGAAEMILWVGAAPDSSVTGCRSLILLRCVLRVLIARVCRTWGAWQGQPDGFEPSLQDLAVPKGAAVMLRLLPCRWMTSSGRHRGNGNDLSLHKAAYRPRHGCGNERGLHKQAGSPSGRWDAMTRTTCFVASDFLQETLNQRIGTCNPKL